MDLIVFILVFIVDLFFKLFKIVSEGSDVYVNSYWWYDWFRKNFSWGSIGLRI